MVNGTLMYASGVILFLWVVIYGFLRIPVIRKFREISEEKMHIMGMMWSLLGLMQLFIASFILYVTWMGASSAVSPYIYAIVAIWLSTMAIFLLIDWKKTSVLAFRIMPFVYIVVSILILAGLYF